MLEFIKGFLKLNKNYENLSLNDYKDKRKDSNYDKFQNQHEIESFYTLEEAIDALGFGKFQIKLSILTGLAWMSDAMEMMILSILSPALHCYWGISSSQRASITTIVFVGMALSSTFWGKISDTYGRKKELIASSFFTFYFGLLSAFSPNFIWLLLLRGLVGFGIGGIPQSVTLYAEFLPSTLRAKCIILLAFFWALGTLMEVLLALIIMPSFGWRWLLFFSCFPLLIFTLSCFWLPESARYYMGCNNYEKAREILAFVALENNRKLPPGTLITKEMEEDQALMDFSRGSFLDLFNKEYRNTTLYLWMIWFINSFCYYGLVLFTTEILEYGLSCKGSFHKKSANLDCLDSCKSLSRKDYTDLMWTTVAEFPGLFLTMFIIEKIGRKNTMTSMFACFSLFTLFLHICLKHVWVLSMIFLARIFISGAFQATYVYTPEVYPTIIRSIGLGSSSMMSRFGALITPFIAEVLFEESSTLVINTYALTCIIAACSAFFLPIETKGRELKDVMTSSH